jgi:hypothetical protein
VQVTMAVIEEFVVVAIYIVLGFFVDKLDAAPKEFTAETEWPMSRSNVRKNLFSMLGARVLRRSNDEEQLPRARH